MNLKIVFGCLFSVFIMMMIPSVSAVEVNTYVRVNRSQILGHIQNIDVNELKENPLIIYTNTLRQNHLSKLGWIMDSILQIIMWMIVIPPVILFEILLMN